MSPSAHQRSATRHVIVAIGLLAVAALVWRVADALVIAFGGIVFASVLLSLSRPLARRTGLGKQWSLVLVIVGLLATVTAMSWLFGNEVTTEFRELQRRLPDAVKKVEEWLSGSPAGRMAVESVRHAGANSEALTQAGTLLGSVLGATANLLLVLFLAIYFAADPELYRDGALRLIPPARRPRVLRALDDAGEGLRKWLVAQVIAMVAVGVFTGCALGALGVPLALSLGVLAGVLEFVPVIGPILAAVPGMLLAFTQGPQTVAYAGLVYVGVQQIESNVITPVVQRWAVKLPPVIGLLSIVACGLLFGVPGVVFAMPIAVVTMVLVKDLYVEDTLENRAERQV